MAIIEQCGGTGSFADGRCNRCGFPVNSSGNCMRLVESLQCEDCVTKNKRIAELEDKELAWCELAQERGQRIAELEDTILDLSIQLDDVPNKIEDALRKGVRQALKFVHEDQGWPDEGKESYFEKVLNNIIIDKKNLD